MEKIGNGLALCPNVKGNPEMIGKRVVSLAIAVWESKGKGCLVKAVT